MVKKPPAKAKKKNIEQSDVDDDFVSELNQSHDMAMAQKQLQLAERLLKAKKSRVSLLDYIQFMMPHPEYPGDVNFSRYHAGPPHRMIIQMFEESESGRRMRSALSIPPQHGKSLVTSHFGPTWGIGRRPDKHIIVAGYGSDFVQKIGGRVRAIMQSPLYKQVFPGVELQKGSKSKDYMVTNYGGSMLFVGRGEGTTGNPCDHFIIDDPIKDKKEADSPTYREDLYDWYSSVAFSRCHVMTPIFIVHTRWHEDDLIGRLCDPNHPLHDKELAKLWNYINIPAIVQDPGLAAALGIHEGSALWPEKFPLQHLQEAQRINPKTFSALYMGRPTPEDGDFFTKEMFIEYRSPADLPRDLRIYAASDHAVSTDQDADFTCMLIVGVDSQNNIWLLDCFWRRVKTSQAVEEMIRLMKKWDPMIWWAEGDHIKKSIEPFLKKRMEEEQLYIRIDQLSKNSDKRSKAQPIQGWMDLGKVRFPAYASWYQPARSEMLKFDSGTNDDFVDTIANIGRGLKKMIKPSSGTSEQKEKGPPVGTWAWVKKAAVEKERRSKISLSRGDM